MTKEKKSLGNLTHMSLQLTEPLAFTAFEMDLNSIMIMVGANGTGKTLIMKIVWAMSTSIYHMIMAGIHKLPFNTELHVQTLFDQTFDDNNFNGTITVSFQFGNFIKAEFEKGKVLKVEAVHDDVEEGVQPIFMSKETRLISYTAQYMKMKKMMSLPSGFPSTESDLLKILELFKIYDIIFMEQLIYGIQNKTTPKFIEGFNKRMEMFDKEFVLTNIKIDESKSDILYSDAKHTDSSVSTIGAGHQALMTMILGQEYSHH